MAVREGGRAGAHALRGRAHASTIPGVSLLRCTLETGRTHQIRVHLAAINHPVVGDPAYGGIRAGDRARPPVPPRRDARVHAPGHRRAARFTSELPPDLAGARPAPDLTQTTPRLHCPGVVPSGGCAVVGEADSGWTAPQPRSGCVRSVVLGWPGAGADAVTAVVVVAARVRRAGPAVVVAVRSPPWSSTLGSGVRWWSAACRWCSASCWASCSARCWGSCSACVPTVAPGVVSSTMIVVRVVRGGRRRRLGRVDRAELADPGPVVGQAEEADAARRARRPPAVAVTEIAPAVASFLRRSIMSGPPSCGRVVRA